MPHTRSLAVMLVASCGATTGHAPFTYPVPPQVGALVVDDAAFASFSRDLRHDLELDLRGLNPTSKRSKDERFVLSMLDALDDRWADAVAELDKLRDVETDARANAMTGLTIRVWNDARAHGGDTPEAFRAALERAIASLPIDLVRRDLGMLRAMGQTFTPEVCRQLVDAEVGPHVRGGAVGDVQDLWAIVFQRYAVKRLVQVGPTIDAVLGAHGIEPPS
jgi:hypothetical protein